MKEGRKLEYSEKTPDKKRQKNATNGSKKIQ